MLGNIEAIRKYFHFQNLRYLLIIYEIINRVTSNGMTLTILEGADAQARVDLLTQCFASYQKVANLRVCYALPINKRSILNVKFHGKLRILFV